MDDLGTELRRLRGHIGWVGMGNGAWGDDGLGLWLAAALEEAGVPGVCRAGTDVDGWISRVERESFDHVVFLDAVDFGGEPGSVIWLGGREIVARFPQVSTHKISLGLLAKLLEAKRRTKCWLLGIQPESLRGEEWFNAETQRRGEGGETVFRIGIGNECFKFQVSSFKFEEITLSSMKDVELSPRVRKTLEILRSIILNSVAVPGEVRV